MGSNKLTPHTSREDPPGYLAPEDACLPPRPGGGGGGGGGGTPLEGSWANIRADMPLQAGYLPYGALLSV